MWVCGIDTMEKTSPGFSKFPVCKQFLVRFGGKYVAGFHFLPKLTCKKINFFFFLPTGFGNEIGMFEEENYFPLKNVTGAANLIAESIFLWLSESWID